MRPKIVFFSNHLRGPNGRAGARSWHQAKSLEQDFDLKIIIPSVDPVTCDKVIPDLYSGLEGSSTTVLLAKGTKLDRKKKSSRALFYLTSALNQFRLALKSEKPDLILTMSLPITLLVNATILSKIRRVPLFVDVRDIPFDVAEEIKYFRNPLVLNFLKLIEKKCLQSATLIFTVSPKYVPYLKKKGIKEEKIIYNPIGYDNFPLPTEDSLSDWKNKILDAFKEKKTTTIITYTGTFGHVVEVELILKAAKHLNSSIGFVFAGDGQNLDKYISYTKENNINAVFLGRVNKKDIQSICRSGDVCIYASKEGKSINTLLGNKVFDYLGAGKPIIYIGPIENAVWDLLSELNAGAIISEIEPSDIAQRLTDIIKNTRLLNSLEKNTKLIYEKGYIAKDSADSINEQIYKYYLSKKTNDYKI